MIEFLTPILSIVWQFFKVWWWILLPFLLIKPALNLWLWWRREKSWKEREYILLEIKIPEEIPKPIKAMEDVFASLSILNITPDDFREKWIEGDSDVWPPLSFELVGIDGSSHFFVRTHKVFRDTVESALYSHYPDIEIVEANDYTQRLPQNMPDSDWDLEGREFVLAKESCYPLKTYKEFEPVEGLKEEKRIDPIAGLLEGFSKLNLGEQVWVQFLLHPTDKSWIEEGEKIRDKLVKRPGPKPPVKPMIQEAAEIIIKGAEEKKEEEKAEMLPPEMMLTPGEREAVKKVEDKISKYGFDTSVRAMYLAKKELFFKPHLQLPLKFLKSFDTKNLNSFKSIGETSTKVHSALLWWMDKRRSFLRKRKMFRNYILRVRPLFPQEGGRAVLNVEELASIIHFPGRMVAAAPFVPRIEAKKGEAPAMLPVE